MREGRTAGRVSGSLKGMASEGRGPGVVGSRGWMVVVALGILLMVISMARHAESLAWVGLVAAAVGMVGLVVHSVLGR